MRLKLVCFYIVFLLATAIASVAQVDITTWQADLNHTGLNSHETTLTPASVTTPGNFGLLFTQQTDGQTYGQPLFVSSQTLNNLPGQFSDGMPHNVIYLATQAGTVYAFDADADPQGANPNGTNSSPLWSTHVLPAGTQQLQQTDTASSDIMGPLSITTTPVIDATTGTLYIVSTVKNPPLTLPYQQYIYALDLKTGNPKFGSPVAINAAFSGTPTALKDGDKDPVPSPGPGKIPFSPLHEHLRSAMVLYNGIIYLAYASHSDETPYHGEILGYDATTLQLVKSFIVSPNDMEGGIWQSGAGPAIDSEGNLYVVTGNGAFDQAPSQYTGATDWGESVLRLPTNTAGEILIPFSDTTSWFTPSDWAQLNNGGPGLANDRDLGGGGMLLLPDQPGNHPHIMVGGGKAGVLYVLDRDNLGGLTQDDAAAIQEIIEPAGTSLFVTPAYFNGNIYYAPDGGSLKQRQVQYDPATGNYISTSAITSSVHAPFKGAGVFISSNGNNNGVVWTVGNALTAYDARSVANPIYNVTTNVPGTGGQCTTAKFSLPIAVNGKVYFTCFKSSQVPGPGYLFVYGVFPQAAGSPNAPSNLTASATSSSQITLNWTNNAGSQSGFTFIIQRSTSPNGQFAQVKQISANITTYVDSQLTPGTTYFYQVLASNTNGSNGSNVASATTFPAFVQPGLVAYWNMDDQSALPTVPDVTGNSHNGTSLGEAGPSGAGYINGSWVFHGTSAIDRIGVSNKPDLQFSATQSFTLSLWANPAALTSHEQTIIAKSADQGNEYGIYINANNQWIARGPAGDLVGPAAALNAWTNITLVQDGNAGTRSLYINGVLQATGAAQAADGAGDFWMGMQNVNGNVEGYQGQIDEVRLYNIALTPGGVTNTLAPAIVDAVSNQTHGSSGVFGITLQPALAPQTEPRIPSASGSYSIVLHFAAPVSGVTAALGVQPGVEQTAVGQVGTVSYDSTNTIVTVPLTGVHNAQALNLHLTGILPLNGGATVAGTADVPFNILEGDVTGDHYVECSDVDCSDVAAINANLSPQLNPSNFLYDVNEDGVVNTSDVNAVTALSGTNLAVQTDANLALFKKASASTENTGGGNVAASAFDNNFNTRWESVQGPSADPSWLQVDLGRPANIHSLVIDWENAAAASYLLQGSNDNSTWTNIAPPVTGNNGGGFRTYSGLNANARYVRVLGETRTTPYGYSIYEFQVIGSYGPPQSGEPGTAPSITSALSASGTVGTPFSYQITASQNPISFSASGLPAGLNVNASGIILGMPTAAGVSSVTLAASNSAGTGTANLQLTINQAAPTVPAAPASVTAIAGTGQITLNWTASNGATSYNIYRGTASGSEAATPLASSVTATSFLNSGLTNGQPYFYQVTAVNSAGESVKSPEVSATPHQIVTGPVVYQINAGGPAIGNFAADELFDTGGTSGTNNTITVAGVTNAAPAAIYQTDHYGGAFTYTLPALQPGAAYTVRLHFAETYWTAAGQRLFNVAINGSQALSNFDILATAGGPNIAVVRDISATANSAGQIVVSFSQGAADLPKVNGLELLAAPVLPVVQINSGGPAVAPFTADQFFTDGGTSGTQNTVSTAGVANAAPMSVYQTDRFGGSFTYNLGGFTPGGNYVVRLHFAETYWTSAGKRQFNVAINGAPVLSNFDILSTAGGPNIAVVESESTTSDSSGNISIAFTGGAADLPKVNGIEVVPASGTTQGPAQPAAITGLFATPGVGQVALTWNPGNAVSTTYNVYRGSAAGQEAAQPIASGLTSTSFIDTTVTNQATYYYTVSAVTSGGTSTASNEVSAIPGAPVTGTAIYQVNAGGQAVAPFAADEFFTGGSQSGSNNPVNTTAVVSPAPAAVYTSEHNGGNFSYVFPNLHAGTQYLVRLHFNETYWTHAGQRVFNVAINNTAVLQNFDIVATAGAPNTALVEQFTATADANGQITVAFSNSGADQPKVSGIEIYQ
ncbi:malectin domain-containing carbohydrate-binding protein [Edaphobacter aggregans]|uniref:malectin domain-containing carbohydrate-binding protein n=1 Tax=Edaphobacter aggregans TaxID=570835 RepID=UPI00054E50DD|nr:malectin domain-containing carbohydrate-binding protein [Edaphobacter aggregans]